MATGCAKFCEKIEDKGSRSENNPGNQPEIGKKGLTWMIVEVPDAAEERKAQVGISKVEKENFGMDSRRNLPRKERYRNNRALLGDENLGGARVRKEVFRPQVWWSNSERLLRYRGRKFGKFVDAKNFLKWRIRSAGRRREGRGVQIMNLARKK